MSVLETDRLLLRQFTVEDAAFVVELLNEPSWIRFIGDRGVRTLEDARGYLLGGPMAMYQRLGFGLYAVDLKSRRAPIGMCGLIKRDGLEDVDIGFAFLPRYWGRGYAREAAAAVMRHATGALGLARVVAITAADNESSIRLLEALGFELERMVTLPGDSEELKLFAYAAAIPTDLVEGL